MGVMLLRVLKELGRLLLILAFNSLGFVVFCLLLWLLTLEGTK